MNPSVVDSRNRTALRAILESCTNARLPRVVHSARILLDAGSPVPDDVAQLVTRIGTQFEFHRAGFNPDYLAETDAALSELYRLFDVAPVARRITHDGTSPITVRATDTDEQFDELWELLVPSGGSAATIQGEVIRLAGRIARELLTNGASTGIEGSAR